MFPKRKFNNYKRVAFFLLIIFVLMVCGVFLRNLWFKIAGKPEQVLFEQGWNLKSYFWGLSHLKELVRENELLKKENLKLLQKIQQMYALQEENKTLKESLKIKPLQQNFSLTILKPIAFDQSNNFLYLSASEPSLLQKNTPVLTSTKQIVGVVDKNFSGYVVVKLITAPDFKLIARTEKNEEIILKGEGNFQLALEKFPKDKKIEKGEKIFTSQNSKFFPANFLIGEVKEVINSDIDPFQKVEVTPYFLIEKPSLFLAILNWRYPDQ
ncbi:rod shape-determining protein MreC [bacterium]|nr:rod shape-determining protein MreC [bacterium]